jgi:hypothetical protein
MFDFFFILYFCIQELQTYNFMNTFLANISNNWVVWFYIIVLFPFQVYDIYKNKERTYKDIIIFLIYSCFVLLAGIQSFVRERSIIEPFPLYIILIISYFQSIVECFKQKTIRSYLFIFVFSIFIILIILKHLL